MIRRLCGWCGVTRRGRWWSRYCRSCAPRFGSAGIYLQSGSPRYRENERRGLLESRTDQP